MTEPVSLAYKINKLFDRVRKPDGKPYSSAEVAAWCQEHGVENFSRAYLAYLRKGQRTNPTQQHLAALAEFFGVSPAYFFDDEQSALISAQIDLAAALRDGSVRGLALRDLTDTLRANADRMSLTDVQVLTDLIQSIAARRSDGT
jgi:transcriptional regulator with XRE-family HTH domain